MATQAVFDPYTQTWHSGQPQVPPEEFYNQLEQLGGLVGFFEQHPHFIQFIMMQLERMVSGVLDRKLAILHRQTSYQANLWAQQFPNSDAANIEKTAKDAITAGLIPMVPGIEPGSPNRQEMVTETLDLQSHHFISQLTDTEIQAVEAFHNRQHNLAQKAGYVDYNHQDPNQATAYTTAWGTTYKQGDGQWNYASHNADIYSTPNNGYPPQPPNGMGNPYQPPPASQNQSPGQHLGGTLATVALGYLTGGSSGGNQPTNQYQAPPPQQQYYY